MAYFKKYREILQLFLQLKIQYEFKAQPTDIFLASYPKTGTTWLKALIFATINRTRFGFSTHPLLTNFPPDCFPLDLLPDFNDYFCKQIYLHLSEPKRCTGFKLALLEQVEAQGDGAPFSTRSNFELFCQGISNFGPYLDQVVGYWKWSLENPEKILFLTYEELKKDPLVVVKRLAELLGQPFSLEEESKGMVEQIIRLCSFESLSNLEVNKSDIFKYKDDMVLDNNSFFRKGKSGDWKNYLTDAMIEHLDKVTLDKLSGSGLTFGALSI
ncbi:hypothetical protein PTKIN_Ptkin04bG0054000 [Pterospermum kingtungense]